MPGPGGHGGPGRGGPGRGGFGGRGPGMRGPMHPRPPRRWGGFGRRPYPRGCLGCCTMIVAPIVLIVLIFILLFG